ncbi:hypothetical protein BLNAU_2764 [Blattamonas nauphoetae]|uniref:RING-type E3 ubiquitin transferase n=1 Tax=Blattamonas nauphoetae TaxID=2049346 RepID=A0ABQ9YES8_9EUKA|nr:hypothetical protein BLNAU_2764 [Blattamonas nauphoetae]
MKGYTYVLPIFISLSLVVLALFGVAIALSVFERISKPINLSVRSGLRYSIITICLTFSPATLGSLVGPLLCDRSGTYIFDPLRECFSGLNLFFFIAAVVVVIIFLGFSLDVVSFLPSPHMKHRGFFTTRSLSIPAFQHLCLLTITMLIHLFPDNTLLPVIIFSVCSLLLTLLYSHFIPYYHHITNQIVVAFYSALFVTSIAGLISYLNSNPETYTTSFSLVGRITFWIVYFVGVCVAVVLSLIFVHRRYFSFHVCKPPNFICPRLSKHERSDFHTVQILSSDRNTGPNDISEQQKEQPEERPLIRKYTSSWQIEASLRFMYHPKARHNTKLLHFSQRVYQHQTNGDLSDSRLLICAALFETSFAKNHTTAIKYLRQASTKFPSLFGQWLTFSLTKELKPLQMDQRQNTLFQSVSEDSFDGSIDGSIVERTRSSLSIEKQVLSAVQSANMCYSQLARKTYSLPRVYHHMKTSVDTGLRANVTLIRQLLQNPTQVELYVLWAQLQDCVFRDTDCTNLILKVVELIRESQNEKARKMKKDSTKDGDEDQEINPEISQEEARKKFMNVLKSVSINNYIRPRMKRKAILMIAGLVILIFTIALLAISAVQIQHSLDTQSTLLSLGRITFYSNVAATCVNDLYIHSLQNATLLDGYIQSKEKLKADCQMALTEINSLLLTALTSSASSLGIWSAKDSDSFKSEKVGFNMIQIQPNHAGRFDFKEEMVGLLDMVGQVVSSVEFLITSDYNNSSMSSNSDFSSLTPHIPLQSQHSRPHSLSSNVFTPTNLAVQLSTEMAFVLLNVPFGLTESAKYFMHRKVLQDNRSTDNLTITAIICFGAMIISIVVIVAFLCIVTCHMKAERKSVVIGMLSVDKEALQKHVTWTETWNEKDAKDKDNPFPIIRPPQTPIPGAQDEGKTIHVLPLTPITPTIYPAASFTHSEDPVTVAEEDTLDLVQKVLREIDEHEPEPVPNSNDSKETKEEAVEMVEEQSTPEKHKTHKKHRKNRRKKHRRKDESDQSNEFDLSERWKRKEEESTSSSSSDSSSDDSSSDTDSETDESNAESNSESTSSDSSADRRRRRKHKHKRHKHKSKHRHSKHKHKRSHKKDKHKHRNSTKSEVKPNTVDSNHWSDQKGTKEELPAILHQNPQPFSPVNFPQSIFNQQQSPIDPNQLLLQFATPLQQQTSYSPGNTLMSTVTTMDHLILAQNPINQDSVTTSQTEWSLKSTQPLLSNVQTTPDDDEEEKAKKRAEDELAFRQSMVFPQLNMDALDLSMSDELWGSLLERVDHLFKMQISSQRDVSRASPDDQMFGANWLFGILFVLLIVCGGIGFILAGFFVLRHAVHDAAAPTFIVALRNAAAFQMLYLSQQMVYGRSPLLDSPKSRGMNSTNVIGLSHSTNPVTNSTNHFTTDQASLFQLSVRMLEYFRSLNYVAIFGFEFGTISDTGLVHDSVVDSLQVPRMRGQFPNADKICLDTQSCLLYDEDNCVEGRMVGIGSVYYGLDNLIDTLITATSLLLGFDDPNTTTSHNSFHLDWRSQYYGQLYTIMTQDGRDGLDRYLGACVDGTITSLKSTRTFVLSMFVCGFVFQLLFLLLVMCGLVQKIDSEHQITMGMASFVGRTGKKTAIGQSKMGGWRSKGNLQAKDDDSHSIASTHSEELSVSEGSGDDDNG